MMKTFSKIFIYTISTILLAWLLPWSYRFITAEPISVPFTLYSSIIKNFAYVESNKNSETQYKDFNGNSFTIEEYDSILPFFYYRQLLAKEKLPEVINGTEVSVASIRKSNFSLKQSTRDVNMNAPKIWMMMESVPSHVDLEEPKVAFRISYMIEFIDMKSNKIDENKSRLFDKVMKEKGFKFPVKSLNGNPTTKKEYDEGYIMIDAESKPFHVKMMKGRPYVKSIDTPEGIKFKRAIIAEFPNKELLAFLSDETNNLYLLNRSYQIHKLPFTYNPEKEDLMIIGNMMDWTARVSCDNGYSFYAVDANDYSLIMKHDYKYKDESTLQKAASYIFPFTISFTSSNDKWVIPRIDDISTKALILNIILLVLFAIIKREKKLRKVLPYYISILIFGLFVFIPLLVIKK